MFKQLFFLFLFCIACSTSTEVEQGVRDVSVQEAVALLAQDPEIVVLDIRTAQEFRQGHIVDAVNIDFRGADFKGSLENLDRQKPYLLHCASGGRSTRSLALFEELRFERIFHLKTGINGWLAAGEPLVK